MRKKAPEEPLNVWNLLQCWLTCAQVCGGCVVGVCCVCTQLSCKLQNRRPGGVALRQFICISNGRNSWRTMEVDVCAPHYALQLWRCNYKDDEGNKEGEEQQQRQRIAGCTSVATSLHCCTAAVSTSRAKKYVDNPEEQEKFEFQVGLEERNTLTHCSLIAFAIRAIYYWILYKG